MYGKKCKEDESMISQVKTVTSIKRSSVKQILSIECLSVFQIRDRSQVNDPTKKAS